jgi:hypothetical protein
VDRVAPPEKNLGSDPTATSGTVTFAGTGGKTRTTRVSPPAEGFDQINVGDMVALEVTRARRQHQIRLNVHRRYASKR